MDSGVSRIQMRPEQKKKERQEKKREKERSWKPERKVEKPGADNYCMFQSKTPQRNVGANVTSRS